MSVVPPFACPACHGKVVLAGDAWHCASCGRSYPVIEGIPDFRLEPDPWIGLEDDRDKARLVGEAAAGEDLEGAVRAYWALTPGTPTEVAERFVDHVLRAEDRSREWLGRISGDGSGGPWIDLGCGTADLLAAAGGERQAVGVDVALRWLVVARRRLEDAGVEATLACANAEHLPFADGAFARVLSLGLVEHCPDKDRLFAEVRRVLRPGGTFRFRTVNRYSLLAEPHVGVWGVGMLPRAWADPYVRWRTGRPYGHHWPEGSGRLRRSLRRAGFRPVDLGAAPLLDVELEGRDGIRRLAPLYERLRSAPVARSAMRWVSPLLESRAVAA